MFNDLIVIGFSRLISLNLLSVPNPKGQFTIVIPPPNVTGTLHVGHALATTVLYFSLNLIVFGQSSFPCHASTTTYAHYPFTCLRSFFAAALWDMFA